MTETEEGLRVARLAMIYSGLRILEKKTISNEDCNFSEKMRGRGRTLLFALIR
jgi:hypothetical protein